MSSGASLAADGSGDEVGASGVTVRPSRGGRPCTAEILLSRAMPALESLGGVDEDSIDEA